MRTYPNYEFRRLSPPTSHKRGRRSDFRPRVPQRLLTVLADISGSMTGSWIGQVNLGLSDLARDCRDDVLTAETLQVQLVTFGGNVEVHPFVPIGEFIPPRLVAGGVTPMPEAILAAVEESNRYATALQRAETDVLKPLYFLFSDGQPTSPHDIVREAAACVAQCEHARQGAFYAFGVNQAAVDALRPLFVRDVHLLRNQNFAEFFRIVSVSVHCVSANCVSEDDDLTPIIRSQLEIPCQGVRPCLESFSVRKS